MPASYGEGDPLASVRVAPVTMKAASAAELLEPIDASLPDTAASDLADRHVAGGVWWV
jgi:hypothetical protein